MPVPTHIRNINLTDAIIECLGGGNEDAHQVLLNLVAQNYQGCLHLLQFLQQHKNNGMGAVHLRAIVGVALEWAQENQQV